MSPTRRLAEGGRKAERDAERAAKFAAKGPEGGPKVEKGVGSKVKKAPGRRTNVGRKAEATDQFRLPRCGLCVMKLCAPGTNSASSSCQTLPDGVSPNTEGGQTADGRWNRPTNFGHHVGDLLDMSTSAPMLRPHVAVPLGGGLWPPPAECPAAHEGICS
jgi:hypothetical protein